MSNNSMTAAAAGLGIHIQDHCRPYFVSSDSLPASPESHRKANGSTRFSNRLGPFNGSHVSVLVHGPEPLLLSAFGTPISVIPSTNGEEQGVSVWTETATFGRIWLPTSTGHYGEDSGNIQTRA
jgi:hypothetical protein